MPTFPRKGARSLNNKLRSRAIMLVLSVAITCMLVFTFTEYEHHERQTIEQLQQVVMLEHAFIEKWIEMRMSEIHFLANMPSTKKLNRAEMKANMQQFLGKQTEFSYITYVDQDGIANVNGQTTNLTDRQYFQEGKLLKESISSTLTSKFTGKPVIIFSSPVTDENNEFIGLVTGAVNLTTIDALVKQFRFGEHGESYLVALDGTMITESRFTLDGVMDTEITRLATLGESPANSYTNYRGVEVYGAYQWANQDRWLIIAEAGKDVVIHSLYTQIQMTAAIILLAILAAIYLSFKMSKKVTLPIEHLLQGVQGIKEGDYSYKIDSDQLKIRTVELVELVEVYNGMSAALRSSIEELRMERNFVGSVLDAAASLIVVMDAEGRIIRFNQACKTMTGHTLEEVYGRYIYELLPLTEEREAMKEGLQYFMEGGAFSQHYEQNWSSVEGEIRLVAWSNALLRDQDGQVKYMIATGKDITEQRRAEKELADREEHFRSIVHSMDETVTTYDDQLRIVGMFGRSTREVGEIDGLLGKQVKELMPQKDSAPHEEALHAALQGIPSVVDWSLMTQEDGIKHYHTSYSPYKETNGQIKGVVSVGRDVTELKQAEEAYRESEQRVTSILESITDAFMALDRDWRFRYINREAELVLGKGSRDVIGTIIWDEFPRVKGSVFERAYRKAMEEQTPVLMEEFVPNFNAWFEANIYPSKEGISIYLRNVTERKQLELKVEEGRERVDTIIETVPNGILVIDEEGTITLANEMAEQMLGIPQGTAEEAGFCIWNLHSTEGVRYTHDKLPFLDVLKTGQARNDMEFSIRDGEQLSRIVACNAAPLTNKDGKVTGVLVSITDITMRVMAEAELKNANDALVKLSSLDGLTGVYNRRYFDEMTTKEWQQCCARKEDLSIILLDIDCFKMYNDTYGHQGGDMCLKTVASLVKGTLTAPSHYIARYGGEEFACVLPGVSVTEAGRIAEEIRTLVEAQRIPHAKSMVSRYVTVSMGVAAGGCAEVQGWEELVASADRALYEAKSTRNAVVLAAEA
nr:PAS domain S-box protein [Paenibacillus phyllosphaerae]